MDCFDVLAMVGGLALFLYGMNLMGEGLSYAAGRLKPALAGWAGSPVRAALAGTGVTAVVQSSSAVTVMAVGLVNSGAMELEQAAGVIMGANIGTTATAWILGLAGVSSQTAYIRILKPASFAPILAIAGVAVLMHARKEKWKRAASSLIGFAIMIFGMETMCDAAEPLAGSGAFAALFLRPAGPLQGALAGMALTALIQSSSASMGILQALCATGAVSYGAAIPLILGQNIGTCVTALLSGVGASKNAKCAALVHFYFNGIGAAVFLTVFCAARAIFPTPFWDRAASGFGVAFLHSAYNIGAVLLLLPFSGELIKLARLTVRWAGGPEKKKTAGDSANCPG